MTVAFQSLRTFPKSDMKYCHARLCLCGDNPSEAALGMTRIFLQHQRLSSAWVDLSTNDLWLIMDQDEMHHARLRNNYYTGTIIVSCGHADIVQIRHVRRMKLQQSHILASKALTTLENWHRTVHAKLALHAAI